MSSICPANLFGANGQKLPNSREKRTTLTNLSRKSALPNRTESAVPASASGAISASLRHASPLLMGPDRSTKILPAPLLFLPGALVTLQEHPRATSRPGALRCAFRHLARDGARAGARRRTRNAGSRTERGLPGRIDRKPSKRAAPADPRRFVTCSSAQREPSVWHAEGPVSPPHSTPKRGRAVRRRTLLHRAAHLARRNVRRSLRSIVRNAQASAALVRRTSCRMPRPAPFFAAARAEQLDARLAARKNSEANYVNSHS